MQLNLNGVNVTVSEPEVSKIVLAHIHGKIPAANASSIAPRIGEAWSGQGGIYAGIMRGRDGGLDYHLIVGPEIGADKWQKAMDSAATISRDGHSDYTLPYRAEQALMYANVPELFEKEWYWSCEQHAGLSVNAWAQAFGYGGQSAWLKSGDQFRARAVRRLPI